ncbi:MAG: DUF4830 domain-containing protein [Ruminococcus sp.]|nr:DUF4830 domain-containing protein [Ruminococcus sp.]
MKKYTFLIISVAVLTAAIFIIPKRNDSGNIDDAELISASDPGERIDYFASHGWEVEEIAGRNITIPNDFSDVYEEYAQIQDKQGLPLRNYAGCNATLYVYNVKNYAPENKKMLAELIVCDNTAVASMVYSEDGGTIRCAVS